VIQGALDLGASVVAEGKVIVEGTERSEACPDPEACY